MTVAPTLDAAVTEQRASEGMRILVCVQRVPLTGGRMCSPQTSSDRDAAPGFTIRPLRMWRGEACGSSNPGRRDGGADARPAERGAIRETLPPAPDRGICWRSRARSGTRRPPRGRSCRRSRTRRPRRRLRLIVFATSRRSGTSRSDPGGACARTAGGDRSQGPDCGGWPGALRAGGGRRTGRLRPSVARRGHRARGNQPASLPIGAGQAASAPEARGQELARAPGLAPAKAASGGAGGPGQAGGDPGRGAEPHRPWSA